jgi:drug/metabolite transporter (DMT)-like permease
MTDNLRGIIAILISATAFVLNDTLMKLVAADIPAGEALFLRGIGASVLLFVVAAAMGQMQLAPFRSVLFNVRAAAAAASAVFIILSLQRLPLPTVSAVIQVTPLAVMAGAALLFKERIGVVRWLAALSGFAGVLLIIRPGSAVSGTVSLLVLAALSFTVLRDLCTRRIPGETSALLVAFAGSVMVMLAGAGLGAFETWLWPTARVWTLIACASGLIVIAYTAGVVAMRTGDLSAVVPFRYSQIPMTLALGYLIWGDIPDMLAFLGIAIVAVTGLFVVTQERRRGR